jgi:hypothetical protein
MMTSVAAGNRAPGMEMRECILKQRKGEGKP